jgi:hypothetical protein
MGRLERKSKAEKWNAPIVEAPKGRRDEFGDPYFRGAKPDQVVVMRCWIVQYNLYVNDQRWGRTTLSNTWAIPPDYP